MAIADHLKSLAAENVVYLVRRMGGWGDQQLEVFRGRLRQTVQGEWVFTTGTGQNGVVGLTLGQVQQGMGEQDWTSAETPDRGIEVTIPLVLASRQHIPIFDPSTGSTSGAVDIPPVIQPVTLTTVIPSDLTE